MRKLVQITFLAVIFGCETVVDIELPEQDSKLTANALMNSEEFIRVSVSASKGTMEPGELESITNAEVTFTGSDGTMHQTNALTVDLRTGAEYYQIPITPEEDVDYSLEVSATGFESVFAATRIPTSVDIISVDTITILSDGQLTPQIQLKFGDPANTLNFYEIQLYALVFIPDTIFGNVFYTPLVQELFAFPVSVDDFFGGSDNELFFDDALFDGKEYTQPVNYFYELPFVPTDSSFDDPEFNLLEVLSGYLICELRTLSEDYFQFHTTYNNYRFSNGDPFAQPVQVFNNVNGGFGIFAGYISSFDTVQVSQGLLSSPLD